MSDEIQNDDPLEGDRGIPSVSKDRDGNGPGFGVVMTIFAIVGALVLWMFWPESGEEQDQLLPAQVEAEFDRERIAGLQIPDLPRDLPPLPATAGEGQTVTIGQAGAPRQELSPEEIARLQAAADLRERRKRSPLVIYDSLQERRDLVTGQGSLAQPNQDALLAALADSAGGSELPPNLDTLGGRLQNAEVERVTASYMADREFIIAQGKMIGGVIETAISSDLPGMVRAVVSESVYSEDGTNLLIEKGSRLVGEYRAGLVQGQGRIFVIWNRVITPWGIDIQITSPGTGPLGLSGHGGWIDSHFRERFGASILLSLIGAATAQSNDNQFAVESGENFNDSAAIALENSINIRPTLHKNQGDRIKIFVARDLNFKPVLALRSQ